MMHIMIYIGNINKKADWYKASQLSSLQKIMKERIHQMKEHTEILLQECHSGLLMAIDSMEQVLPYAKNEELKKLINDYKEKHERLKQQTSDMMCNHNVEMKKPGMIASAFSWVTAEVKLMLEDDSNQIAKLMMDGSNMGIQSITECINKNEHAADDVQSIAKKIVRVEEEFLQELKRFL